MKKVIVLCLVCFFSFASVASAYKYTKCGDEPCDWDHWPVKYYINELGTPDLENEFEIVQNSFSRWEVGHQGLCGVEFEYGGLTPVDVADHDGKNIVIWTESGWQYGKEVLALTQCWYDVSGHFLDCDIVVNGQDHIWNNPEPGPVGEIDLRSTLTHEIGHLWGLDHSDLRSSTMYAFYDFTSFAMDLDYDDIIAGRDKFCPDEQFPEENTDWDEQNDSPALSDDWGDQGFELRNMRLYDDDWFRLTVPAGKRAKVIIEDGDLTRSKMIYLANHRGDIEDGAPCDGNCAVALGEVKEEDKVMTILVRAEFDDNSISTEMYDILVQMVNPGQEGELYDDDTGEADGEETCGCDPAGGYGGITPHNKIGPTVACMGILAVLLLIVKRRFVRR